MSASSLFGVINADGKVYPEILEDKLIGNLRENDMNFLEVWKSKKNKETKILFLIQSVSVPMSAPFHLIYLEIGDTNTNL